MGQQASSRCNRESVGVVTTSAWLYVHTRSYHAYHLIQLNGPLAINAEILNDRW